MAALNEAAARWTRTPDWTPYRLTGTGGPGQITLLQGPAGTGRQQRRILVALPPGTEPGTTRRLPVLYLHDGQNLFDPATSHAGDWGLVTILNELARDGVEAIVVGVPHRGRLRSYEYNPFRDLRHGGGGGDRYLEYLFGTVMPLVERSFPARTGPGHTAIGGSSLGGLISLYALWRRPGVFGAASVQSPALWVAGRAIFRFLERHPVRPPARIYLDVGTAEGPEAIRDARALRDWLHQAGQGEGVPEADLRYLEDPVGTHTESAWGRRLRDAIPFLLSGR